MNSTAGGSVSREANGARAQHRQVTKADLEGIRARLTASGGRAPRVLDRLIERFDDAAGAGQSMTAAQFKSFAAENSF